MNDRELLELAANAAGIEGEFVRDDAYVKERWHFMRPYNNQNMMTAYEWNPLTDDGDALRLAVKLQLYLEHYHNGVCCDALGKPIW
jgi:hypothetical protein